MCVLELIFAGKISLNTWFKKTTNCKLLDTNTVQMATHGLSAADTEWSDFAPKIEIDENSIDEDEEFDYNHVVHILSSQVSLWLNIV